MVYGVVDAVNPVKDLSVVFPHFKVRTGAYGVHVPVRYVRVTRVPL